MSVAHGGEEDDLADRALAGHQHHEAVDADADAAGRRHAVLERAQERLVHRLRLLVALGRVALLRLEAGALVVGVVELGERVGELHAVDERLEALDEPRLAAVSLGERRQLDRVVDDELRLTDVRLDVLGEQVVDELRPGPVVGLEVGAVRGGDRGDERVAVAMGEDVDPRLLEDRVAQRHTRPRRREVDLAAVAAGRRHRVHHLLDAAHLVGVVRVGLVPLDHRELGVVLERHALVAEVLAELVHALEAAHDEPLEIELGRDAQVQRAVELVVVRRERAGERAAVDRLQHGRLDLDEPGVVEIAAHGGDRLRAHDEQLARLVVGDEVELAPAEARLDVVQAVELVGGRPQALGEDGEVVDAQAQLAAARAEREAVDADQVAEVELEELCHALRPEDVGLGLQLDAPGAVVEVEERHLALAAARVQAPGHAVALVGVLAGGQARVRGVNGGHRHDAGVRVRVGVDAGGAETLELLPPRGEQLVRGHGPRTYSPTSILVILSLRAGPRGTCTDTTSLRLWPISARPTGDSLESLFSDGFASAEPTIVNFCDLPVFSSLTETTEPTWTASVEMSFGSTTWAERRRSSSWAMRCSSIICSFFASSYSEFSEMSPNSRASLMRSATSRRRVVCSCWSSSLSRSRPSGVRMTSRAMAFFGRRRQKTPLSAGTRGGRWAMRAGQYSARLSGLRQRCDGVQEGPRFLHRRGLLEGLTDRLVRAEALDVPGVELAQIAPGTRAAEVLDGALHDPLELGADLVGRGLAGAGAEEPGEEPGVAERPASEHHGGGAGVLVGALDRLGIGHPAGEDHGRVERRDELRREVVVGRALVVHRGAARMEADRADARLVHEAVGELEAVRLAGALARAKLHGDGQAAPLARGSRDLDRRVRVFDQRGARAGLADLRHRTAHVQVDQVGAALGDRRGGGAHDVGVLAEELDRDRAAAVAALVGMDPQHLDARLLVAVVDPEARHHLRHREPGAVALGLEPDEPVADAGERREHDPVRDPDGADVEGVGEGGRHARG